jgi:hypothetical protein
VIITTYPHKSSKGDVNPDPDRVHEAPKERKLVETGKDYLDSSNKKLFFFFHCLLQNVFKRFPIACPNKQQAVLSQHPVLR